jgi:hypothetical protein
MYKNLKTLSRKFLLLIVISLQQHVVAHAAVVFSNLGSGDSFNISQSRSFGYEGSQIAYSFSINDSASPFFLDSIDIALHGQSDGSGVAVNFATNMSGGLEPDTILESSSVFVFSTPTLKTASFSGTTLIDIPGTYWVWVSCTSGCSSVGWHNNSIAALSDLAEKSNLSNQWNVSSSQIQGAFRVNGTVVPIPPAIWLFASGLLGMIGVSRCKKAT